MITFVYGCRPNAPKLAPIVRELERRGIRQGIAGYRIISTGQHANTGLDIYEELGLPPPDASCIAKGSHAKQTAIVMQEVEEDLIAHRPKWLVVVGDVNSTLGAALAAAKLGVKIAHVEAGLRSHDWTMPEEINRVLVDDLADLLLCTEDSALGRLYGRKREEQRIVLVGNVMVDSLVWSLMQGATGFQRPEKRGASGNVFSRYALITMHRPSNVDTAGGWSKVVQAVDNIEMEGFAIVWPHHPRAPRDRRMCDPLGYRAMVEATRLASLVLTDSGGVQEETTALKVPCLTFRNTTERPITISHGTNTLVGTDPDRVGSIARSIAANVWAAKQTFPIPFWDGNAAERIVDELLKERRA